MRGNKFDFRHSILVFSGEGEYENDALEQFDKWSVAEYDAWPGGWTFYCNWSDPAPLTYWDCVRTRLQLHTH